MLPLALLALSACNRPATGFIVQGSDITVSPEALDFGQVTFAANLELPLTVANAGTDAALVTFAVEGPFTLAATTATVDPGATYDLDVRYAATSYAAAAGVVTVTWDDGASAATVPVSATTAPDSDGDGQAAVDAGGPDCDDGDATIYEGASDPCYDHVDQDCDAGGGEDPEEVDCDGDAVRVDGGDCDDRDASVYPDAPELSADGVDQDCDGLRDEDDRAFGDLVVSEVKSGASGWIELCNVTAGAIPVDGFVITWSTGEYTLPGYTLDATSCLALCERLTSECALKGSFAFDAGDESLVVTVDTLVLDSVTVEPSWTWGTWDVASLDGAQIDASLNDSRSAWCDTHGSPGATNPACP